MPADPCQARLVRHRRDRSLRVVPIPLSTRATEPTTPRLSRRLPTSPACGVRMARPRILERSKKMDCRTGRRKLADRGEGRTRSDEVHAQGPISRSHGTGRRHAGALCQRDDRSVLALVRRSSGRQCPVLGRCWRVGRSLDSESTVDRSRSQPMACATPSSNAGAGGRSCIRSGTTCGGRSG